MVGKRKLAALFSVGDKSPMQCAGLNRHEASEDFELFSLWPIY
jgi:hypothetical protein